METRYFYLWTTTEEDNSNFFWAMSSNGGCYSITRTIHFFTDKKSFYKLTLYKDSSDFFTDDFGRYCLPRETRDVHFNDIEGIDLTICEQTCFPEEFIIEESVEKYLKKASLEEALYSVDTYISSCYDSEGRCSKKSEVTKEPLLPEIVELRKEKLRKLGFDI